MEIRLAHPNEVERIVAILDQAKAFLAASGSDQWQGENGYPNADDVIEDILSGQGYVALLENQIVAYAAVIDSGEPAYEKIYDGKWAHNNPRYVVFHRIAVASDFSGQQIAQTFLQGLIEGHSGRDFRCDTHEKNTIMQHILEKLGYVYCGKVPIEGERLAYQKIKSKNERALFQNIGDHYETD
ncbi:GNAT family N-acetyltransferase [Streptococcus merionis]|uniref:GNAT family N-acetyltransferase n=1 Tax=Streptococcus merionis TaxID=400065 RepID=UPI003513F5BB